MFSIFSEQRIRTRDSFAGKDAADTSAGTDYSGGKAGNMEAD
jgi:hypothetical protein